MNTLEPRVLSREPMVITSIHSAAIGQDYRLFIALPRGYDKSNQSYPVLYVLDGHALFLLTREIVERVLPDLLLVGISYPVETHMDTVTLRGRDFTFNVLSDEAKAGINYPFDETGGGERFLDFLKAELIPHIEGTYRVSPHDRGLLGQSMGADFGIRAVLREPALFPLAAFIGPWVDNDEYGILAAEARYATTHRDLPIRLFLATEEYFATTEQDMGPAFRDFTGKLRSRDYAGLTLWDRVYEGENHVSVIPIAITHALRALYGQDVTGAWADY